VVRSDDTAGRLGGDEFAVVLNALSHGADASRVAQKIISACDTPFSIGETELHVTLSIGIALYPADGADTGTLLKHADVAMYSAKAAGRNAFKFYNAEMNTRALDQLHIENSLRHALMRDEFELYYQPKADVATGKIIGFEALLRWHHAERGMISPSEFIPILEETGLILPVGEWVLESVCSQLNAWASVGIAGVSVAINLSARQFASKDLAQRFEATLAFYQIDPRCIELEITESALMADPEVARVTLDYLKALGVRLSIDDFGTGYSSLAYLKRFPIDTLKIDASFVRDITTNADDAIITRTVIAMAHNMRLNVVAEGVETAEQLAFLAKHGCDQFQGYYLALPQPAAAWEGKLSGAVQRLKAAAA
jgi:predicted signal transduction protein with EAL and GGDEF domain